MEKKDLKDLLKDDELAAAIGGYVIIDSTGCYELYDDAGNYQRKFRGDQLEQLRKYARRHGISDEFLKQV